MYIWRFEAGRRQ